MQRYTTGPEFECYVDKSTRLMGEIQIGRFTYISENGFLWGRSSIGIGSFCSIGPNFQCITHEQHPVQYASTFPMGQIVGVPIKHGDMRGLTPEGAVLVEAPIQVGHDVWIGKDVALFGGVTIGNGCIIGAKSLVTKDCIPYGIYAGTPAKLIRTRFSDEIIAQLLTLEWWNWSNEKLRANARFFEMDFTTFEGGIASLVHETSVAA